MTRRGFPHSDIPGSKLVCSSPRLFAAYRVLHRLLAPRHSPCALSSLTIGIQELTIGRFFALKRTRQSLFLNPHLEHTAVFVDRKNYRLQDIQLSKIFRGASLRRTPHRRRSLGPLLPAPLRRGAPFGAPDSVEAGCRSRNSHIPPLANSPTSESHGGEYRARTGDLLVANQALSQLS